MSLIAATQLTAIATAVLAFFAILTALFGWLAFRKQSREVRAIEQQVTDQQELAKQQAELLQIQAGQLDLQRQQFEQQDNDRRRAQASLVFMWIQRPADPILSQAQSAAITATARESVAAHLQNTSEQPIYDIEIAWRKGTARWEEPERCPALMPGERLDRARNLPLDMPLTAKRELFGAVARFRDSNGTRWLLRPDGALTEEVGSPA